VRAPGPRALRPNPAPAWVLGQATHCPPCPARPAARVTVRAESEAGAIGRRYRIRRVRPATIAASITSSTTAAATRRRDPPPSLLARQPGQELVELLRFAPGGDRSVLARRPPRRRVLVTSVTAHILLLCQRPADRHAALAPSMRPARGDRLADQVPVAMRNGNLAVAGARTAAALFRRMARSAGSDSTEHHWLRAGDMAGRRTRKLPRTARRSFSRTQSVTECNAGHVGGVQPPPASPIGADCRPPSVSFWLRS